MAKNTKNKQKQYDNNRQGTRTRNWTFILYPEDAPSNYLELLESLIVPLALSPLHDRDCNADGSPKKPHYHGIITFGAVKHEKQVIDTLGVLFGFSQDNAESIVGVATPKMISSMESMVKYLTHAENPEKEQYAQEDIIQLNGFNYASYLKFSKDEILRLMIELDNLIRDNDITEYAILCELLVGHGRLDLYEILTMKQTTHYRALISSLRHQFIDKNDNQ